MIWEIIFWGICIWAFYMFNVNLHRDIHNQYDVDKDIYK